MMYEIRIEEVAPQTTAAILAVSEQKDLPRVVPALCGEVWNFITSSGMPKGGHMIALYKDMAMNIEVGAEVSETFEGNGRVVCSELPGGRVATTTHIGDYSGIGNGHMAIKDWCQENGHETTGIAWEVYGHQSPEATEPPPADLFWLLKP